MYSSASIIDIKDILTQKFSEELFTEFAINLVNLESKDLLNSIYFEEDSKTYEKYIDYVKDIGIYRDTDKNTIVLSIIKLKESKNNYNKLTLDYKGRDLGRLELNLKRNENQTFSIIDENTNDEIDYNLLLFIKYAVAKKDFDYTISDILSKTNILLTPTQLGSLIQRNLQLLEKEGLHITSKRTANERLWHCSYEEPSENNE